MINTFDFDLEKSVLGGMISDNMGLHAAMPLLKQSDIFFSTAHQYIFNAIQQLYINSEPVDILTVTNKLRNQGKLKDSGDAYYISSISGYVPTSNIEFHCRILVELFLRRYMMEFSNRIQNEAQIATTDVLMLVDHSINKLSEANSYLLGSAMDKNFTELVDKTFTSIITKRKHKIIGIPTGFPPLSEALGGWQKKKFYIIEARPSHGKTSFAVKEALEAAIAGKKVVMFTPDQNEEDIVQKMICIIADVEYNTLKNQSWDKEEYARIEEATRYLKTLSIYINDDPTITPNFIRTICREMQLKEGIDILFIDYIQLLEPDNKRLVVDEAKVASISKAIKALCRDLDIPVIALAQLSRDVENRTGSKRPRKSDLRHSGQLEQDADVILSLYHPFAHNTKVDDDKEYMDLPQEKYNCVLEIGFLKGKMMQTGEILTLWFNKRKSNFYETYEELAGITPIYKPEVKQIDLYDAEQPF